VDPPTLYTSRAPSSRSGHARSARAPVAPGADSSRAPGDTAPRAGAGEPRPTTAARAAYGDFIPGAVRTVEASATPSGPHAPQARHQHARGRLAAKAATTGLIRTLVNSDKTSRALLASQRGASPFGPDRADRRLQGGRSGAQSRPFAYAEPMSLDARWAAREACALRSTCRHCDSPASAGARTKAVAPRPGRRPGRTRSHLNVMKEGLLQRPGRSGREGGRVPDVEQHKSGARGCSRAAGTARRGGTDLMVTLRDGRACSCPGDDGHLGGGEWR
jgi:hypothetical protein